MRNVLDAEHPVQNRMSCDQWLGLRKISMQIKDVFRFKLPECCLQGMNFPLMDACQRLPAVGVTENVWNIVPSTFSSSGASLVWWKMGWHLQRERTKAVGCQVPGRGRLQGFQQSLKVSFFQVPIARFQESLIRNPGIFQHLLSPVL